MCGPTDCHFDKIALFLPLVAQTAQQTPHSSVGLFCQDLDSDSDDAKTQEQN